MLFLPHRLPFLSSGPSKTGGVGWLTSRCTRCTDLLLRVQAGGFQYLQTISRSPPLQRNACCLIPHSPTQTSMPTHSNSHSLFTQANHTRSLAVSLNQSGTQPPQPRAVSCCCICVAQAHNYTDTQQPRQLAKVPHRAMCSFQRCIKERKCKL